MLKRNIFIFTMAILTVMSSCSSNGTEAETGDAANVEITKTDATTTLKSVKEGSIINWRATHLGGLDPRFGKIQVKDATVLVNDGTLSNASVSIDMSTLTVENFPEGAEEIAKLTGHLQSEDFFNIEKFPTSKFELTKIENTTGDYNSKVTGNLTILAVTKSITFNANVKASDNGASIKSEDFTIDRTDWGLTYNVEGTTGVPLNYLIANDIGFGIDVTVMK